MMQFDLPKEHSSIIKVIGVGGGGSNAVNHMYNHGIRGVDFMVCNTDSQALDGSPIPLKIQLGESLTDGKGAGSIPEVGKNAAIESIDDVKSLVENNTSMAFITAGMGGGTGTGAAPVIAKACKDLGILTVGIVTLPFSFEGKKRKAQAEHGIEEMRDAVDTLLIIQNDKLREVYGSLTMKEAFSKADDVLATAARGIAETVSVSGFVNVDMNDVKTVMQDSGVAIMGSGKADGENRSIRAVEAALESPLLNDNDIAGAQQVLLNITVGDNDVKLDEFTEIADYIQDAAGQDANVIWGYVVDETYGESIGVTVIATGFQTGSTDVLDVDATDEKKVTFGLEDDVKPVNQPMNSPFEMHNKAAENPFAPTQPQKEEEPEPFLKKHESVTQETPKLETPQVQEKQQNIFNIGPLQTTEKPIVEKKTYNLDDDAPVASEEQQTAAHVQSETTQTPEETPQTEPQQDLPKITPEERQKLMEERMENIKQINAKLRTPSGISELEKEPAYMRRNLKLDDVESPGKDPQISKFSLDENGEMRKNNSFLHDNVD